MSKLTVSFSFGVFALLLMVLSSSVASAQVIPYTLDQSVCTQVQENATWDARWKAGLSTEVDQEILGGDVVAYQIQWGSGSWSTWYVTGVNDISNYANEDGSLRRRWALFYDHTHMYIICSD